LQARRQELHRVLGPQELALRQVFLLEVSPTARRSLWAILARRPTNNSSTLSRTVISRLY
jgi:hypothetical protein